MGTGGVVCSSFLTTAVDVEVEVEAEVGGPKLCRRFFGSIVDVEIFSVGILCLVEGVMMPERSGISSFML